MPSLSEILAAKQGKVLPPKEEPIPIFAEEVTSEEEEALFLALISWYILHPRTSPIDISLLIRNLTPSMYASNGRHISTYEKDLLSLLPPITEAWDLQYQWMLLSFITLHVPEKYHLKLVSSVKKISLAKNSEMREN